MCRGSSPKAFKSAPLKFPLSSAATKVLGRAIPVEITSRRSGDPAVLVADISLAGQLLKWKPKYDIEKMVSDTWESANAADSK